MTDKQEAPPPRARRAFPLYGFLGLALVAVFWYVNWYAPGLRTHWAFFPLWLGYCLTVDALVRWRTGTSLLTRSAKRYAGLFAVSAPVWWLFELINLRTRNWVYLGADQFGPLQYAFWTTLSFTTVIPAVFGAAELASSFGFLRRLKPGPVLPRTRWDVLAFFVAGCVTLLLMLIWPSIFFPFAWISPYLVLEPVNIWLGNRSLADSTGHGDWRPVFALWIGVLLTAFFWEMWNFRSLPKWTYSVPWGDWAHVFEMPALGYGGYLPFALELFALYQFIQGLSGRKQLGYVRLVGLRN